MEREESKDKDKCMVDAKLLLNQENYILEAKRIPMVDIDDIQEDIRCKIWKEDRTKGMNSDNRMVRPQDAPFWRRMST
jgi:hypothetical protein